jgi:phosphopantetheinyl transferase
VTAIHVQLVRVMPGAAEDSTLIGMLGAGEWEGVRSLGFAADRDRAVTARAAARLELGRRLGVHPRLVPLVSPGITGGRPVVLATSIGISWSHSGAWVALAFSGTRPVGVDIEQIPERVPLKALESIGVGSLEDFVAREAVGKATGKGLAAPWPSEVSVRPFEMPAGYLGAVAAPGDDWWVTMEPWELRAPPASASVTAIGFWDVAGTGSRRTAYAC